MRKILLLLATATLCILLLTGCGESNWTVSISGEQSQISAGDAAALQKLQKSGQWQDGLTDCAPAACLSALRRCGCRWRTGYSWRCCWQRAMLHWTAAPTAAVLHWRFIR